MNNLAMASLTTLLIGCALLLGCGQSERPATEYALMGSSTQQRLNHSTLTTKGRFIVDQMGNRVKLAAINWYGASDGYHIVGGLDMAPRSTIIANIRALGFNAIRLPFSNAMLHVGDPISPKLVAANPDLKGKTPLQIYDAVVHDLTAAGIYVILNNHTTTPVWCCGYDENALWFNDNLSEEQWIQDWESLAQRYRDNSYVIGADLRNEIREGTVGKPNWGYGDKYDWRRAAEVAGNRILAINPRLLIIVEGTSYAIDLSRVKDYPVRLNLPGHLVYSSHSYSWAPDPKGGTVQNDDYAALKECLMSAWLYIDSDPVWVGEFGAGPNDDHRWLNNFVRILQEYDLDFAVWPLNVGPTAGGAEEEWGLLTRDWQKPINDWRTIQYQSIEPR